MDNNVNTSNRHSVGKDSKKPVKRRRRSPYSFLPLRWSRGSFLKWLWRTHAWLGLWGAALGIPLQSQEV